MPQNLEAERAVLCAMMLSPDAIGQAQELVPSAAFFLTAHQKVYDAIVGINDDGGRADLITVCQELSKRGELEPAGGRVAVASLLDQATTTANLAQHARIVIEKHQLRSLITAARWIQDECFAALSDPDDILDRAETRITNVTRDRRPSSGPGLLESMVMTERQLMAADLPPVDPVVSDHDGGAILIRGGVALVGGLPGSGKTFLIMQLIRAVAFGTPFLGWPCVQGRAALLEFEMPAVAIRNRFALLNGDTTVSDDVDILAKPQGLGPITDVRTQRTIAEMCTNRSLSLLVLDPWNQVHDGDVNRDASMGPAMGALQRICDQTGVCILFIHHLNKIQFDKNVDPVTAVLLAMKGAGALADRADTVFALGRTQGRHRLVFGKTRYSGCPREHDLRQLETGFFERSETPAEISDANDLKILKWIEQAGDQGVTLDELARYTRLGRTTIQRHLSNLDLRSAKDPGKGGKKRFFAGVGSVVSERELWS